MGNKEEAGRILSLVSEKLSCYRDSGDNDRIGCLLSHRGILFASKINFRAKLCLAINSNSTSQIYKFNILRNR